MSRSLRLVVIDCWREREGGRQDERRRHTGEVPGSWTGNERTEDGGVVGLCHPACWRGGAVCRRARCARLCLRASLANPSGGAALLCSERLVHPDCMRSCVGELPTCVARRDCPLSTYLEQR